MERPFTTQDPAPTPPCSACGAAHAPGTACPPREAPRTLAFGAPVDLGPAATADPLVGTQVGSFRIVRMLGRGGMGTVYLGEHPAIGSRVAIKFLHESMSADPEVVRRFYDEARAVNLIGHENIVAIYDLDQLSPARYFFVMEYLEGESLTERLGRGPLDPEVALDVLLQLCDALQCAHEHGVVHRDLKPDNVFLVSRRGKRHFVKLLDFGIAKLRDAAGAGGTRLTAAGLVVGTPEYMAPEQCDVGTIDARTDVYALGVMAYEMVTGRLPFTGRTVPQLLLAHLHQEPPPPSSVAPGVDPRVEHALLRALRKRPEDRFPDMTSFADALSGALGRARPAAVAPAIAPPPPPPSAPPAPATRRPTEPLAPAEVAPAAAAPALAAEVELRGKGGPRRLPVADLGRAGAFLAADRDLPPLLSRVELALAHPSLRTPVELSAEVVRHVSPAEAQAWRMRPGFAVQFVDVSPAVRAALATVADASAAAAAPAHDVRDAAARLRDVEARAGGTHYDLLALPPDAEFSEVRRAAKTLRAEIEALRERPEAADQPARATALLARLEAATQALASPAERLRHDAQRGNFRGVARCLAAGLPAAIVEARRRELLAASPARAAEAQRQLARAQVARKLGNAEAAAAAWEAALAADPLDAAALEAYLAWRRGTAG